MGASNKYTADEQLDQIAFYWINMHGGDAAPLTVRLLGRNRDVHLDLGGGNRIPKITERKARNVAELRAAGVGVDRVLMVHDGTAESSDLFEAVLTMLDPTVSLAFVRLETGATTNGHENSIFQHDLDKAEKLGRQLEVVPLSGEPGSGIVQLALEGKFDVIILPIPLDRPLDKDGTSGDYTKYVVRNAHCRVFLAAPPPIPIDVEK
jgi:nucleotide-binding universal stress UspA family protein